MLPALEAEGNGTKGVLERRERRKKETKKRRGKMFSFTRRVTQLISMYRHA